MTDRNIFDFLLNLIQNDYRPLENGEHRRRRRRPRREPSTPQPPQSRPRRSRVNRNRARDRRRWETYTLCIICFEPTAIPTHLMPCCRQFIHEECLLQCFRHSSFHQGYRCPHCRGNLFPVDADDLTAETHPPPGHYLYIFNYSSMGTLQHDVEEIAYDRFMNPPLAPRPPGLNWEQVRAEREAQLRDLLGIDVNQDN